MTFITGRWPLNLEILILEVVEPLNRRAEISAYRLKHA